MPKSGEIFFSREKYTNKLTNIKYNIKFKNTYTINRHFSVYSCILTYMYINIFLCKTKDKTGCAFERQQ